MMELLTVLCALNMGLAAAALTLAVLAWRGAAPAGERIPHPAQDDVGDEEKAFKLSDTKMQEGIANLLGYEVGNSRRNEDGER